jgi:hypothetical protein
MSEQSLRPGSKDEQVKNSIGNVTTSGVKCNLRQAVAQNAAYNDKPQTTAVMPGFHPKAVNCCTIFNNSIAHTGGSLCQSRFSLPRKEALGAAGALLVLGLLRFLDDRLRSVSGCDPACRAGHDRLILKPQESEVVDALGKIRLNNDVSRNHRTRDVSIVGAIVAVGHRL